MDGISRKNEEEWKIRYGFITAEDQLYARYGRVKKPRLPVPQDQTIVWTKNLLPNKIEEFIGNGNMVSDILNRLAELSAISSATMIICGTRFTGKTSLCYLLNILVVSENILYLKAPESTEKEILHMLKEFLENKLDSNNKGSRKKGLQKKKVLKMAGQKSEAEDISVHNEIKPVYVFIDDFHVTSVRWQEHMINPLLEKYASYPLRTFLTVSPDASTVIEKIKSRAEFYYLNVLSKYDILERLLSICIDQRVGYNREGLNYLLEITSPLSIQNAIKRLQNVFIHQKFISAENIKRCSNISPNQEKKILTIEEIYEPFRKRCDRCTLYPPCKHITVEIMYRHATAHHEAYPIVDNETCLCYQEKGYCKAMITKGKCNFNHPKNIYTIDSLPIQRMCHIHSLPKDKCVHCADILKYKEEETKIHEKIIEIEKELAKIETDIAEEDSIFLKYKRNLSTSEKELWGGDKRDYDVRVAQYEVAYKLCQQRKEKAKGVLLMMQEKERDFQNMIRRKKGEVRIP